MSSHKPVFPWNGSKVRLLPTLEPYLRSWGGEGRFVEPFLGTGIVSRMVREMYPHVRIVAGDANPWLISAQKHWLSGTCGLPTEADVTSSEVERMRRTTDAEYPLMSERDRARRFLTCLFSAWGNRWQTNKDGSFSTPINVARQGSDPAFLLRRLRESHGTGFYRDGDDVEVRDWKETARRAEPGDLLFLDSPYPETAGYSTAWDLKDWSEMYVMAEAAMHSGVHVLVCNPGTLSLLWDRVLPTSDLVEAPTQGRSTKRREEYVGYSHQVSDDFAW